MTDGYSAVFRKPVKAVLKRISISPAGRGDNLDLLALPIRGHPSIPVNVPNINRPWQIHE